MVAVDLIILCIYFGVEGCRGNLEARRVRNAENEDDVEGVRRITTEFYTYICNSNGRKIFLGILYGYKSLLQILSLFLAFATRRVKVKGLNDTKAVAGAVYVTSITFTVLFVSTYSVVEYINVYAAIFSVALFVGTSAILVLLYIPKMVSLYQDPEGLTVFKTGVTMAAATAKASSDQSTIESLRRRIRELETIVSQNSGRPSSSASAQHLVPRTQHSHRLSTGSDISLEMSGETRGHKTIWDDGDTQKNGTDNKDTEL
ncbi:Gamma-aminobutyric acid type B receptor subunit 2 [Geodia barretti]|uniref:Gamma-aminobutyric acid type B receptor subunit 2 n=1 Tax=Geodia barretti TaxID=519541 RepID=A0AA35TA41_GEOBA|nr:Gamma-aminobutyric acid type B receptor subunit 2 [Geodia barretti]